MNNPTKSQKNIERALSMAQTFKELSALIEKNIPLSSECQILLKLKIQDPALTRKSYGDDIAIIELFSNIEKINPFSPDLIRLLFQIKNPENTRKLVNEKKKIIVPILNEIYLEPYESDDLVEDGDNYQNREYLIYKNYCFNPQTAQTLIEELIPYLSPETSSISKNLYWLIQESNPLQKIIEKNIEEKKIPLNFLLQIIKSSAEGENQTLELLLNDIDQLEIQVFGNENIFDIEQGIEGISYLQIDLKTKQKVKEKIMDSILNNNTTEDSNNQIPFQYSIKNTIQYFKYLHQIQEKMENGILLEKDTLYQKCQNIFLTSQIKKEEDIDQYHSLQQLFQTWMIDIAKEPTIHEKKKRLFLELPKMLKIKTEISILGQKVTLYYINQMPLNELKDIIPKGKREKIPIPFLENILKLKNMYQQRIPYNKTELYQQTYSQYKSRIKETIDHYDKYIEFVFNRIIRSKNFLKYLLEIDTIKKFILFYKTETIHFKEEEFSTEEIETMNPKQWRKIKNRIQAKTPIRNKKVEIEINTNALKLITILGYEITNLLLDQPSSYKSLTDFITGLGSRKNLNGFCICIKEHPNIFELPSELLKNYYYWYLDLSRNLRKKITYEDILEYESISKEEFLKQENYYAISNNISWIEQKNYKRNLFKTGNLWLQQKQRKKSTIPDYQGSIKEYRYEFVNLHDPNLIFLPNKVGCCMTIGNQAESDLIHATINENGRLFAVYKEDEVIAISWVWRNNQVLCFDNIEVKRSEMSETIAEILIEILKDTSNAILQISETEEPEEERIRIITLGRNPKDIPLNLEDNTKLSQYQSEMYHPKDHKDLYMVDSEKQQYIIGGTYTKITEKEPTTKYLYKRKKARKFAEIDKLSLELMIKSIRKDFDINSNTPIYTIGYIGEDFYIGITTKGEIDIVYQKEDKEIEQEVKFLLKKLKQEQIEKTKQEATSKQQVEEIKNKKYEINEQNELIRLIEESLPYQVDPNDFYHGSEKIIEILEAGEIKCPYLLEKRTNNYNGEFHICIAKNLNFDNEAFNSYIKGKTSIILKKELPVIDKDSTEFNFLNPFFIEGGKRTYGYKDEFHTRESIPRTYFKAIFAPTNTPEQLINIRRLIDALEIFQLDLPVINNTNNTMIDKELVKRYIIPKLEDSNTKKFDN